MQTRLHEQQPLQTRPRLGPRPNAYAPSPSVHPIMALQRGIGNQAVQRLVAQTLQRQDASPQASTSIPSSPHPDRIKVWFNAFIPHAQVDGPPGYDCFTGDGRGFSNFIHASSRTHQEIEFDVATLRKTIDWRHVGTSHEVDCATGAVQDTATAPVSELTNGSAVRSGREIQVDFQESASNPLVWAAPAIDASVVFHIDPVARTCRLTGEHDGFPAYEAYVTANGGAGVPVYTYNPTAVGEDINALFPPTDRTVSGRAVSF